jgi:hypothetical protein
MIGAKVSIVVLDVLEVLVKNVFFVMWDEKLTLEVTLVDHFGLVVLAKHKLLEFGAVSEDFHLCAGLGFGPDF